MANKITPHKGGRTIRKVFDLTDAENARFDAVRNKLGLSVADFVVYAMDVIESESGNKSEFIRDIVSELDRGEK